jgi:hypothetical protein
MLLFAAMGDRQLGVLKTLEGHSGPLRTVAGERATLLHLAVKHERERVRG